MKKNIFFVSIFTMFSLLLSSFVFAGDFGIRVDNSHYSTFPGGVIEGTVIIDNLSNDTLTLELAAVDSLLDNTFFKSFTDDDVVDNNNVNLNLNGFYVPNDISAPSLYVGSWVKFDEPQVVLASGESKFVNFKMKIPETVLPFNMYHGALTTYPIILDDGSKGIGSKVRTRIAKLIYVNILPEEYFLADEEEEDSTLTPLNMVLIGIIVVLSVGLIGKGGCCPVASAPKKAVKTKAKAKAKKKK